MFGKQRAQSPEKQSPVENSKQSNDSSAIESGTPSAPDSKERNETVAYSKSVIKDKAKNGLLVAFLILIVNFVIHLHLLTMLSNSAGWLSFVDTLYNLVNSLVGVFIGINISSLTLDFFSYIKYSQERIKEVMVDKTYLNTLADEEKRNVISALESSLYFKNTPIPQDSLYTNIKSKIIPLLDIPYFDDYYLHIDCDIDETGGVINKKMLHRLTVCSPKKQSFDFPLHVHMENTGKSSYKITSLKFDGNPVDGFKLDDPTNQLAESEDKKEATHHLNHKFELNAGKSEITYTSESKVDISDISYSYNLETPCKHYVAEITLANPAYTVKGRGFAIDKQGTMKIDYFENTCRIEFSDWTIPGDGIIFYFVRKIDS